MSLFNRPGVKSGGPEMWLPLRQRLWYPLECSLLSLPKFLCGWKFRRDSYTRWLCDFPPLLLLYWDGMELNIGDGLSLAFSCLRTDSLSQPIGTALLCRLRRVRCLLGRSAQYGSKFC